MKYGFFKVNMEMLTFVVLAIFMGNTFAQGTPEFYGRVARHGTVGLGMTMYHPVTCAYACRSTMSAWKLNCDTNQNSPSVHSRHHRDSIDNPTFMTKRASTNPIVSTTPACYATNDPFLTSLAWCIKTHCPVDIKISTVEKYWEMNVAGRMDDQPLPKYSYQYALGLITIPPKIVHNSSLVLNQTELVSERLYQLFLGSLVGIDDNLALSSQYALVVLLTCGLAPILFSLLRFLPLPQAFVTKFYAYVIDPPLFGNQHAVPVFFGLGIMPTRGQGLFIIYMWSINLILLFVGHKITWPNLWFTTRSSQWVQWVATRAGLLSVANLVLTILYSSRNNLLLLVTDWSRNTFVLLHRWIAVICISQLYIQDLLYIRYFHSTYITSFKYSYFVWGSIGAVAMTMLLLGSSLLIRRKAYQFFLLWHIFWALTLLVSIFLSLYLRYHWQWGYELWVALAFAIWAVDWLLARPIRVLRNGLGRKAYVHIIDEDYVKIFIPGVVADGHVYLYFPTLSWRFWENHPFSAITVPGSGLTTTIPSSEAHSPTIEELETGKEKESLTHEKAVNGRLEVPSGPGLVFFIRKRSGITARLANHATQSTTPIPVLIESSYGAPISLLPTLTPTLAFPHTLLLAGGTGITAFLPLLLHPPSSDYPHGQNKLFWSVRSPALVDAVQSLFRNNFQTLGDGRFLWGRTEVCIAIGTRFEVKEVLERELRVNGDAGKGGTTVVVCGPPGMADGVRGVVTGLARGGVGVRLREESFSF